ncbi:MAG: hypothetical protein ACR2GR_12890 [Rhodothermales bacterium]
MSARARRLRAAPVPGQAEHLEAVGDGRAAVTTFEVSELGGSLSDEVVVAEVHGVGALVSAQYTDILA